MLTNLSHTSQGGSQYNVSVLREVVYDAALLSPPAPPGIVQLSSLEVQECKLH